MNQSRHSLLPLFGITFALSGLMGCRLPANLEVYEGTSVKIKNEAGESAAEFKTGEIEIKIHGRKLKLFQKHEKAALNVPASVDLRLFTNSETRISAQEIGQDYDFYFSQVVTERHVLRVETEACGCDTFPRPRRPRPGCYGRRQLRYDVQILHDDYRFDLEKPGTGAVMARIHGNAEKDGVSTLISRSPCYRY